MASLSLNGGGRVVASAANLFNPVHQAAMITDSVIVAVSGGKDSVVTLDLCAQHFNNVTAFFMYIVNDLSFQNAWIQWAEEKYSIKIIKIPHFLLSHLFKSGTFRTPDNHISILTITDIYRYIRNATGFYWIAAGERIDDSIWRRAQLKKAGPIDHKRGRFYPVINFSLEHIISYIKHHRLMVSPESRYLGHSFRELSGKEMTLLKLYYPDDFEKIKLVFPLIEAAIINEKK